MLPNRVRSGLTRARVLPVLYFMAADTPDDTPVLPPRRDPMTERQMREAEDLALAASGLGSGLLKRQPVPEEVDTVAVLKVCPHCGMEYETAARFCPADGTSLRPKGSDSLIDRVLAERYHILKRIGEGGMGRVYLGEHVKMNRQCAIKVMSPALVNDHESATRFAREASSAARIIHPNVAAVFDYGESEGLVYLVMEYVEGEPLSRIIAREAPLAVERAIDLTRQIADGLGAAHELGIIHRDLKPDNILIARTRGGREVAKVVDFGIAKAMQESGGEALTRTGLVIGTPEFMSPEQLLGDPIDARSDLYALGCIMHLMLTATPPFDAATREQMIKRRLSESAPRVQAIDPGLPDSLDRIVARLLARSPSDRYGSAAEVRDALGGSHLRPSGGHAAIRAPHHTPRSAPTVAFDALANAPTAPHDTLDPLAPVSTPVPSAVVVPEPSPSLRRRRWLAGGGAVAALAVVIALVQLSSGGTSESPSPAGRRTGVSQPASTSPTAAMVAARPVRTTTPLRAPGDSTAAKSVVLTREQTDSVRAAMAARRRRDSLARAERAVPSAVRESIRRYARAIESGDVARIRAAFPAMSGDQEKFWSETFFRQSENIKVAVRFGSSSVKGNAAEVQFTVDMKYDYRSSHTPGANTLRYRATLEKLSAAWQIKSLTETR